MEYVIRRLQGRLAELKDAYFDPERPGAWNALECAEIAVYPWDESGYRPEARAYVGFEDGSLSVLLCAREETIRAAETRCGGNVYMDSCLEFFLMPFPEADARYLNIEVNAAGVAHIGLGEGREARRVWTEMPEGFEVSASKHAGGWWAVCYTIPDAFLRELFGRGLVPGAQLRGNFYKCDESIHPHFGAWSPVRAEKPDFHRPECFGQMRIAQ